MKYQKYENDVTVDYTKLKVERTSTFLVFLHNFCVHFMDSPVVTELKSSIT